MWFHWPPEDFLIVKREFHLGVGGDGYLVRADPLRVAFGFDGWGNINPEGMANFEFMMVSRQWPPWTYWDMGPLINEAWTATFPGEAFVIEVVAKDHRAAEQMFRAAPARTVEAFPDGRLSHLVKPVHPRLIQSGQSDLRNLIEQLLKQSMK